MGHQRTYLTSVPVGVDVAVRTGDGVAVTGLGARHAVRGGVAKTVGDHGLVLLGLDGDDQQRGDGTELGGGKSRREADRFG